VIAGILAGVVSSMLAGGLREVGFLLVGAITTGLAATAIVQGWLDVVEGDWAANAATLSLTVLAIGATVAGLRALLGNAGIALAAIAMVLVGNPFSGVATAPELLPRFAGDLGQALPPGAGGNLLRSTGYFDGAGAWGHVAVLAAWTAAGVAAIAFAALRARRAESHSTLAA
jgi:hypothetical protein